MFEKEIRIAGNCNMSPAFVTGNKLLEDLQFSLGYHKNEIFDRHAMFNLNCKVNKKGGRNTQITPRLIS